MALFKQSLAIAALLFSSGLVAQNENFMLWADYDLSINKKQMVYGGDAGIRGLFSDPNYDQYVFRPSAWYKPNKTFTIGGGMGLFSSVIADAFNFHELRLQQEVIAKWPRFSWGAVVTRFRVDERFFFYENPERSSEFNGRIRPMIGIKTSSFDLFSCNKPFYFQTYWEGFQNFNEAAVTEILVNNTRFYVSIGHEISNGFKYEIHYIWQQSGLFNDFGPQTQQHIIRLRFFHIVR